MSVTVAELKFTLRARIREELRKISPAQRHTASIQACALLRTQEAWRRASSVLFYAPMRYEIDLTPVLEDAWRDRKSIAFLRFDSLLNRYVPARVERLEELSSVSFGIPEPLPNAPVIRPNALDLAFVPGIAFDLRGRRLGRGKGDYDRVLVEFYGRKCGVAFDAQVADEIPVEAHDVLMDYVLTPTRWLTCEPAAA